MSSASTWTNLCQGGGGQCDCECFRPKADDPTHCWECSHGFTVNAPAITQSQPAVCGSSNVAKIFEGHTSRHLTGTSQLNPCQEVLETKSSKLKLLSTLWMTASNKCKPSQQQTSGQTFHVSSVMIITCGIDTLTSQIEIQANGQLMKDPILLQMTVEKRLFIQHLENHGCYLQQMIEVNSSWSHEDVTAQLCSWFLNVFQYFDCHHKKANMRSQTQPDWQLLVPTNGRLKLSMAVRPNGIVLTHFKGRQKSGIADSNLWFYVMGTDEEAMSESDDEVVELLSSIADLKITMVTGTGKRLHSINVLSSTEAMDSNRQSFCKKCKGLLSESELFCQQLCQPILRISTQSCNIELPATHTKLPPLLHRKQGWQGMFQACSHTPAPFMKKPKKNLVNL
ncbi:hypothetical protein F5J12DRAFT_779986 [Pisolithus orientalis]|uniref:uncharacterized protein n=1 Tax=Pisolithus orientalis TaxID=936130 RepID=UPI0022247BBC|nr:uncharacterized protein F5J12DRAFT_779986 [Pisolithus orientalis]KAI6028270.1 hypothetical protein F5J12DRAFT_779986 [Pisolithus orientalis]